MRSQKLHALIRRLSFIRQSVMHHRKTGAVASSSRFLAKAMIERSFDSPSPARILEVGPGNGAFTHQLISRMRPGDRLTIIEVNPVFCQSLRKRLASDQSWRMKASQIELLETDIASWSADGTFSSIISALPFNNFSPGDVQAILDRLMASLEPGGSLSFFEYSFIKKIGSLFCSKRQKMRIAEINRIICDLLNKMRSESVFIPWNIPPAKVYRLFFN
jgi:phosphatidylethanolamine/phosphatidyl-N-methylethanolamine N-methyltransferase